MPSFQDSAVIFFIALLLFGPKKLPELARQLGKLMGEFRRASNEFRMQMEDELRASEQAEKQKQIAAIEAAAPAPPILSAGDTNTIAAPSEAAAAQTVAESIEDPLDSHPHMAPPDRRTSSSSDLTYPIGEQPTPVPIASSGNLNLMPPATGLPTSRSSTPLDSATLSPVFDAIPQVADERSSPGSENRIGGAPAVQDEAVTHG